MERPSLDSGLSHGFTLTFITLCPRLSRWWDCGQGQCSIHPLPLNQCSAHRTSSVNMTGWVVEWRVQNPLSSVPMHQHNTDQSLRSLPRYRGPLIFSVYCRLWSYCCTLPIVVLLLTIWVKAQVSRLKKIRDSHRFSPCYHQKYLHASLFSWQVSKLCADLINGSLSSMGLISGEPIPVLFIAVSPAPGTMLGTE